MLAAIPKLSVLPKFNQAISNIPTHAERLLGLFNAKHKFCTNDGICFMIKYILLNVDKSKSNK